MSSRTVQVVWVFVVVALLGSTAVTADGEASASTRDVVFRVNVPKDTPAGQTVYLLIMPWRSGWWPGVEQQIPLKQGASGALECTATLDEGSVIRYAYDRWDEESGRGWRTTRESAGPELTIDCRLLLVCSANAVVEDTVAAWSDGGQTISTGTLKGTVVDETTGEPLADTDITAAGIHIATRYDGTFEFPALAAGSQRVTAYRSLGDHRMTDTIASIRAGQTSQVKLAMEPAQPVDVTFEATLPEDTPADAEIRIMGSVYQMGARVVGSSLNAPQMPYMNAPVMQRDGNHAALTLSMYEGMYAQYWYTVSDAWYGCEKGVNGDCLFRGIAVSKTSPIQLDRIGTWRGEYMTRLSVYVTAPESTPPSTPIAFGSGPSAWMTPVGRNTWVFHLYGYPGQSFDYAYILGAYSGGLDEGAETGNPTRSVTFGEQDRDVYDVISAWANIPGDWLAKDALPPADFPDFQYTTPSEDFMGGFCLVDFWGDHFPALLDATFRRISDHNGGWVEVSSIWGYGTVLPLPTLESRPLLNPPAMPRQDLVNEIRLAHVRGLKVLLTPQDGAQDMSVVGGQHSRSWWNEWLVEAEAFWLWNAQVAEETGAEALLLPGHVYHAFPQRSDFESKSDARAFDQGVQSMIAKVRAVYHGKLVLGVTPTGFSFPSAVDWLGGTTFQTGKPDLPSTASVEAWSEAYDILFMRTLDAYYWTYRKPVVLYQVDIPSAASPGDPTGEQAQARQLQGLVSALSKRSWVVGMFSFGYMPIDAPSLPFDGVRGRLGEDVLAAYYQH